MGGYTDLQLRLASQIIAMALEEGWPEGHRLKESELALKLGLSRSPVRKALTYLEDKGIAAREPNRGFYLSRSGAALDDTHRQIPVTEDEAVYGAIIADRVRGLLKDVESEADLLRRYGASRSLLVRVLTRLSREGIVERSKGYGWRFLPTLNTERAHDESYRFRLLIEPAGILQPTFAVNAAKLQRLRLAHEDLLHGTVRHPATDMFEMNAAFHEMLAEFSGNRFILQAVRRQNMLRRLLEYRGFRDVDRVRASCEEHLEIIEALEQSDRTWSSRLLERHLTVASTLKLAFRDSQDTPTRSPADVCPPTAGSARAETQGGTA